MMGETLIGGGQSSTPGSGSLPDILALLTRGLNATFNPEQQSLAELAQLQVSPGEIGDIMGSMPTGIAGTVTRQLGGRAMLFGRDKLRDTTRKIFGQGEANRRFVPELKSGATPLTKNRFVVMDKEAGRALGSEFSSLNMARDFADELELTSPAALTLQLLRKGGPFGGR